MNWINDLKQLDDLYAQWQDKENEWYQRLLTLAAGAVTLLALFPPASDDPQQATQADHLLAATWVLLGAGLLSGGAATYLRVKIAQNRLRAFREQLVNNAGTEASRELVFPKPPPKTLLWSRNVMVISLLLAVVCLVAYSVLRVLAP